MVKKCGTLSHHVIDGVVLLGRLFDGVEDEYNLASVLQAAANVDGAYDYWADAGRKNPFELLRGLTNVATALPLLNLQL